MNYKCKTLNCGNIVVKCRCQKGLELTIGSLVIHPSNFCMGLAYILGGKGEIKILNYIGQKVKLKLEQEGNVHLGEYVLDKREFSLMAKYVMKGGEENWGFSNESFIPYFVKDADKRYKRITKDNDGIEVRLKKMLGE